MVCVCSDGTKFGRFLGPASRSISTSAMDVSTDVKSLVRGWLQASPNIGRVKLAPSPLASAFSPRPDRYDGSTNTCGDRTLYVIIRVYV